MATGKRRNKVNLDELINLVRQFPFLFDPSDASYRDVLLKDNWWQAIAERFQTPPSIMQKKWKSVKDRYIRERRIYLSKKKTFGHTAHISPPKWRLYSVLDSFLENKLDLRFRRLKNSESQLEDTEESVTGSDNNSTKLETRSEVRRSSYKTVLNSTKYPSSTVDPNCHVLNMIIPSSPSNFPDFTANSFPPTPNSDEAIGNSITTITPINSNSPPQVDDESSYHFHSVQSVEFEREDSEETLHLLHSISTNLGVLSSKLQVTNPEDEIHYYVMSLAQRLRKLSVKNKHIFKIKTEELLHHLEQM